MGRHKLPSEIKELQGTDRKDRENPNPVSFQKISSVQAPRSMTKIEKTKFEEICGWLIGAGILTGADVDTVIRLVLEITKYDICMKDLRKNGYWELDIRTGRNVNRIQNQLAKDSLTMINSLSATLGLTPASRASLKLTAVEEKKAPKSILD